jgi:hypothetical protein
MRSAMISLICGYRHDDPIEISFQVNRHFDLLGKIVIKIFRCPSIFCRCLLDFFFPVEVFEIQKLFSLVLVY